MKQCVSSYLQDFSVEEQSFDHREHNVFAHHCAHTQEIYLLLGYAYCGVPMRAISSFVFPLVQSVMLMLF